MRGSNYIEPDGSIRLAATPGEAAARLGRERQRRWDGYRPDAFFRFDSEGYDLAPDGERTGWRAFAYTPLPGSFSPASGSTDDVLIRLPEPYREDTDGNVDWAIYAVNLAIVEALISRHDVAIDPVDEARLGVDLDKNGALGIADHVAFDWAPLEGRDMSYVGMAKALQATRQRAARRRPLSARHRVRPHRALRRRRRFKRRAAARGAAERAPLHEEDGLADLCRP